MSIIFKSDTCKIYKNKKNYKLTCEHGEIFNSFFKKIHKNLDVIDSNNNNYVTFDAVKVERLDSLLNRKSLLSYRHLKQLFTNLGKQFESLEKDGYSTLFLKINDIVRVEIDNKIQTGGTGNDIFFLYLNTHKFVPIKDDIITIERPFTKDNLFISPELKNVNSFPINISNKSLYYSLALLTCYCGAVENNTNILTDFNKSKYDFDQIKVYLSHIENTKLYWSLLRCLKHKPEERIYLYI
tara:strand:- start:101 stop:820 length:720 start_codon:yes stop_codon:yes gene_type:complete